MDGAEGRPDGGHYVNVVKAGKWWRKRNADGRYPKGYPLEHLIGANCPDGVGSVAEGLTRTLEAIRDNYRGDCPRRHRALPARPRR